MTTKSRAGCRPAAAVGLALVLGGCAAGTSPVETCVEHAVEEGVDRGDAQVACEGAVGEED